MGESRGDRQPHDVIEHASDRVGSDWAYLSDLAEINPRSPSPTDGETVSFVAMADVSESGVIDNVELRKTSTGYTLFAVGDVLVAKITPCFENGKGAHVRGLPTRCGLGSTEFHVLRPRSTTSDRYLYHLTRTSQFRLRGEGLMSGSAGQRRVPTEFFSRYAVRMPPLEEQRWIAEILDTIDETIQATERVIAKLWTVREGVLRGKLSALLDYPMAPVEHLGAHVSVGIVVRPTQYYVPDGVPVLRSANVREGQLDMTNLVYISPKFHGLMAKTAVVPGDLVTVRTGYPGTTAVVPSTVPEANCVDVVITRTGTTIDPEFLSLWINSEFGKGHVLARQGGLAQQHFNVSDMKVLPVPVVDLSTQRKLVDSDRALRLRPEAEQVGLDKLTATRVGLASDLLNGHGRTVPA